MSLPRISWHIGDYLKDTGHLRAAGHGAYFMLCLHYYANGRLPDDDLSLASIARLSDQEWKKYKPILQAFFYDGWHHKRIDKEIKDAQERYGKRALAGSKGGNAKASAKQNPSNATALLPSESSNAEATLTISQESKKDKTADAVPLPVKKYAFEGGIIKLSQKHFDDWTKAYAPIDLLAELTARDAWLGSDKAKDADRQNWFISTTKYLANKCGEMRAKIATAPKQSAGGWV